MYAVDDLSDAIDVTRDFLTPIRAGTWLKLALVVLFIGGAGFNPGGFGGDVGTFTDEQPPDAGLETPPVSDELLIGLVIVAALVLILGLLWSFLSAVMEFVFIESLRAEAVHVRRYARRNLGRGLRLFLFRVGLGLVALAVIGIPVGIAVALVGFEGLTAGAVLLIVLLAITTGLVYAVVSRFTSVFVTAVMLREDRGVLAAWRRFWPTATAHWKEYLVYLVLIWIVQLAVGIGVFFLVAIAAIGLGLLFGIPVFALVALGGDIGLVVGALVGIIGVLTFIVLVLLIDVPIESYYRYYALLILGDTDAELDLVADQRARVRGDGGTDSAESDHWDRGPRDDRRSSDEESTEGDGWDDGTGRGSSSGWNDRSDDRNDRSGGWDDRRPDDRSEDDRSDDDWR